MKAMPLLIISILFVAFSSTAQTSDKAEKEQQVKEIQMMRKADVATKAQPQVNVQEQEADQTTSPLRKAISTNGVQTEQRAGSEQEVQPEPPAQKAKQVQRPVQITTRPD